MNLAYEILVRMMRFISLPQSLTTKIKEYEELKYWRRRKAQENELNNQHFYPLFTDTFGVNKSFYDNKFVVDLGCGPRGSLEWADNAKRRIGFDPLSSEYLKLGASKHKMEYITGYAESLPFIDNSVDIVTTINSIDHVESLDRAIFEIHRVLKPGGYFLVATDIHAHPTPTEPVAIPWDFSKVIANTFSFDYEKHYEAASTGGILGAFKQNIQYDHSDSKERYGVLILRGIKK